MAIRFEDFSDEVAENIKDIINTWLIENSMELESQATMKSRSTEVREKWESVVDKDNFTAYVGNPLQKAIWEEFGTGEYAVKGNGRRDWWVYVKGQETAREPSRHYQTEDEAMQTVAYLRGKGLEAYATKGQEPTRALHLSYVLNEDDIKEDLQNKLRSL